MILQPGTTLKHGDYTIIEKLGDGGFGITYLAEQTILGRKVAIKELFLSKICTRDGNTVTVPTDGIRNEFDKQLHNFLKEARNIAKMRHSGIVPVIDMFEENGTAYYVMEYFCRGSLAQLQKSRPGGCLQESEALRYIRQIADALSYVHNKNLLHLDLKPGNILLDDNNNAILIDFGICKHYDESGNITVSTNSIETSRTPGYAPFEQYIALNLKQFSPSTDIYSLGATFYKLLTGNTPPPANERYYDDTIPPLPDEISASTRTAIEQAMRMDKRQRPQNIDEFLALLDASPTSADKSDETTKINPDDVEVTITDVDPAPKKPAPEKPAAPENKPQETPAEQPADENTPWKWVAALTVIIAVVLFVWQQSGSGDEPSRPAAPQQPAKVVQVTHTQPAKEPAKVTPSQPAKEPAKVTPSQPAKEPATVTPSQPAKEPAKKQQKYDYVSNYSDGLARVRLNGKEGYIDKNGNEVIPCKYDDTGSFSNGLASVKLNGREGFIDTSGNVVIPIKYQDVNYFIEGLAAVKLNGKWGFIDKSDNVVISFKYENAYSFNNGRAKVKLDGEWFFIDKSGNRVVTTQQTETAAQAQPAKEPAKVTKKYDEVDYEMEGLRRVKLNYKYGFIDKSGNEVIPIKYDGAGWFKEGLAWVKLNGKRGFVDKRGNEVIPLKYDEAHDFSEGLAAVKLNGKYGFIDKSGNEVIPLKYDGALFFSEGLADVTLNGKDGFIDKSGNVVVPFKYDGAWHFREGRAAVRLNDKWGFIDKSGNEVIPIKYECDLPRTFDNGRIRVKLKRKWFYIDKNGNKIK